MHPDLISDAAAVHALVLLGGLHEDGRTIYLLGPDIATFWDHLQTQPEATGPDPVDRYSTRALNRLAHDLGAEALFPFGTPPQPFITWALKAGCTTSPVHLLVHPDQGLWVSFRGALAFDGDHPIPAQRPAPCLTCATRPCLTACLVGALTDSGYDLPKCHAHLDDPANTCMAHGCRVRRTCPASPPRADAQSAHHMSHFHR